MSLFGSSHFGLPRLKPLSSKRSHIVSVLDIGSTKVVCMSQYPKSQDAAYVQYLIGLTYSKQIVDVTQDQRASAKTIEAMQAVIDNYPNSEYVDDAQAKIRFARDQLAGKEMQIGRYYMRGRCCRSTTRFRRRTCRISLPASIASSAACRTSRSLLPPSRRSTVCRCRSVTRTAGW